MLVDRFVGSLVGLALGDALGAPVENLTAEQIRESYGRITGWVGPQNDPARWRRTGLHTDDTQQALIIAEAIAETGWADPDVIVQKMIDLSEGPRTVPFGAYRGSGRSFRFSVQLMRHHGRWSSGARNTGGIGASMRVAPVGLFFAGDDASIRENAALSALITHTDPRGVLAACAVAYLAGRAVLADRQPLVPAEMHAGALDFVRRTEGWLADLHGPRAHPDVRDSGPQFGDALAALQDSWTQSPASVLPGIQTRASELAGYDVGHPSRGFALAGVITAIYLFLRYRDDYRGAVLEAVNAGGDADSVAAIAGALCGAAGGESAIPEDWRAGLIAYEQIRLRALALAGEDWDEERWRPLDEYELELTLEEDRMRRAAFPPDTFPEEYVWEEPRYRERIEEPAPREREPYRGPAGRARRPRGSRGGRSRR